MSANEYTQIGWIGLGQMGLPMVTRLLDGGIEVGVYNRSPDKTAPISAKGAKVYGNTAELVRDYPVIFLMVSDYAAVCDILNGVRDGLAGKIIVNMSTTSPRPKTSPSKHLSKPQADSLPKHPFPDRSGPPPTARC